MLPWTKKHLLCFADYLSVLPTARRSAAPSPLRIRNDVCSGFRKVRRASLGFDGGRVDKVTTSFRRREREVNTTGECNPSLQRYGDYKMNEMFAELVEYSCGALTRRNLSEAGGATVQAP